MNFGGEKGNVQCYYWIKYLEKGDEYKSFIRNKINFDFVTDGLKLRQRLVPDQMLPQRGGIWSDAAHFVMVPESHIGSERDKQMSWTHHKSNKITLDKLLDLY